MKICNALALPTLMYRCETWAIRKQDKSRITSVEMKFMGRSAKYRWQDYKNNEDILPELKINPFVKIFKITEMNVCKMFCDWTETD
jgi:hypothetical protein